MSAPEAIISNDERLAMLIGFQAVADNLRSTTTFIERGKGIYVYDSEGREYIEAASSFYVAALGYQNEELIEAITAQYARLPFYPAAAQRTSRVSVELAERLAALVPIPNAHILYATTGSEANDFLIKMLWFQAFARGTPERRKIIGRRGSYAGATLASASLTGAHHAEFGLPLPEFLHVSQPDYHGARHAGETAEEYSSRLAEELDSLLEAQPEQTVAAMIVEPVSFSASIAVPPRDYFSRISTVLSGHDVDLVADEVITGFGRTGAWFGCQTLGFEPDHLVAAKGITSGYFPLSVIAMGEQLYNDLDSGSRAVGTLAHAATYAAHPVGVAAALKTIEIMQRDRLVEKAEANGRYLNKRMTGLREHPLVGDVRTIGLAGTVDFLRRDENDDLANTDAGDIAERVYRALVEAGVLARQTERCVQISPPLIIERDEIDVICDRIAAALDAVLEASR